MSDVNSNDSVVFYSIGPEFDSGNRHTIQLWLNISEAFSFKRLRSTAFRFNQKKLDIVANIMSSQLILIRNQLLPNMRIDSPELNHS